MNKIFLILTLFSCASVSMADDMKVMTLLASSALDSNIGSGIGIEHKNRTIMSDYKSYSQASRQQMQLKQAVAVQQYSHFLKNKRAL